MATKWAPEPLHSKGKIRISRLQELLFAHVVHSVGVSKYMDISQQKHKQIIYANTYIYAFLFQSTKFIINNFFHVDYAYWLIMKSDEIL